MRKTQLAIRRGEVKKMSRKKIQGPILSFMLSENRPVKRGEIQAVVGGSSSGISGALTRLNGNGVVQRNPDGTWIIIDRGEAKYLTEFTYHTKNRPASKPEGPRVVGVIEKSPNGEIRMGDLFEMIGRLPDGSRLVRTLDSGTVYKLEEV
jgi:hypothetical protein